MGLLIRHKGGDCVPEVSVPGRGAPNWRQRRRATSHIVGVSVIGLEISRRSAAVSRQLMCSEYASDCTVPLNKVLTHEPVGLSPVSARQRAFSTEEALNDEVARMTQPVSDLGHTSSCTAGCESSTYKGWELMDTYFSVFTPWRDNSEECSTQLLRGFLVG